MYIATVPQTGSVVNIGLASPDNAVFPAKKLTLIGGEFPKWSNDGNQVHWSLGKGHFVYNLDDAQASLIVLKLRKKLKKKRLKLMKKQIMKKLVKM